MAPRFQLLPLYFGLGYDSVDFVLDVGRLMKFKIAATETGSRSLHLEFRLIANVGSVTDESGMVANVMLAVEIGLQAHSVQ